MSNYFHEAIVDFGILDQLVEDIGCCDEDAIAEQFYCQMLGWA